MAQTADQTLEQRILDLEAALRALRAATAFGQVFAESTIIGETPPPDVVLTSADDAGFGIGTGWLDRDDVHVDLLVPSGRLRVDVAASIVANLASGSPAGTFAEGRYTYGLYGPADDQAGLDAAPSVTVDYTQAVTVYVTQQSLRGGIAAANWGVIEGLEPGWYRVVTRYGLGYSATAITPNATFSKQRLAAMPY
jgi:hypothetical protein